VRFCPLPPDDPVHRRPDITRAQLLLNWNPRVELRQGLERTIADFETRLANPQGSRVRATLRRVLEHTNGKHASSGVSLEHSNGKPVMSDVALSQAFFERAELAHLSPEAIADFEGLWVR